MARRRARLGTPRAARRTGPPLDRKHQTFVSGAVASMVIAVLSLGALAYQRNQANAVLYAANTLRHGPLRTGPRLDSIPLQGSQ